MTLSEPAEWCVREPPPRAGYLVVQKLTRSGRLRLIDRLTMPGYFDAGESQYASIVLDDSGQLAAAVSYENDTFASFCEPHDYACCSLAAIATWELGGGPGALDSLAPYGPPYLSQAEAPALVLAHSRVNAVWTTGESEFERPLLEQAYGSFGAPLHTALLRTGPTRTSELALRPGGRAAVSWLTMPALPDLSQPGNLDTASGSAGGLLRQQRGHYYVPRLGGWELGFATDDEGHTVFGYEPEERERDNEVMLLSGKGAHRFSDHRVIGHLAGGAVPHIVAGGHERLLFVWADMSSGRIYAELGSISGTFAKPVYIGTANTSLEGDEYQAFIDSRGQAVVVFQGSARHRRGGGRVFAAVAPPNRSFQAPRPITPSFVGECGLRGNGTQPSPAAVSPDGHALIQVWCEHGPGYLVRYAP